MLSEIVRSAFEEACPTSRVIKKRKPVTPLIMELIRKKRKLRREKSSAMANGDLLEVQRIQKDLNLVGNRIKKEQKMEERLRHESACHRLST